jgi:hypothetical protein
MPHRLLSLVLAALIGATPVAREICDLSCAALHAGSSSSAHTNHHQGPSTTGHEMPHHGVEAPAADSSAQWSVSPAAHGCRHEAESQPASLAAKVEIPAPTVAPHAADLVVGPVSAAVFSTPARVAGLTPVPIALRTPLRV